MSAAQDAAGAGRGTEPGTATSADSSPASSANADPSTSAASSSESSPGTDPNASPGTSAASSSESSPGTDPNASPGTNAASGSEPSPGTDPQTAFLRVERGNPTAEELAALTVTLAAVAASASPGGDSDPPRSSRASRRSGVKWGSTWHSLHPGWARGRGWVGW